MDKDAYKRLAEHLDALPQGFPPTPDGRELLILKKLFSPEEAEVAARLSTTPEEAEVAARLSTTPETVEEIAARTGLDAASIRDSLKAMARRGLIEAGVKGKSLAFETMPFVVGFYEMQVHRMDAELARLVENYFQGGFGRVLSVQPQFHRVIPAHEAEHESLEVRPFESAAAIVDSMQSWGVLDCICRKQKALIGQACQHPIDVCLAMHPRPGVFDDSPTLRPLSRDEAMATLQRASAAGLVHTVTNTVEGTSYICNCCTCSCGILRGMAELGIANVVASSPFVNQVQEALCTGCEACIEVCQFSALSMDEALAQVERERCVGCGVCVLACSAEALLLVRRPEEEIKPVPQTSADWRVQRGAARAH